MRFRHLVLLLKILIGATLIYLLLREAAATDVLSILSATRLPLAALALAVFMVAVALNAFRWRIVLDTLGTTLPLRVAVIGTFEGMFFNLFLPTGVGGDVVRAYRAYDYGLDGKMAAEGALIDRALGLWGLGLAVAIAAPFSAGLLLVPGWRVLIGLVAAIIVGGLAVAWSARFLNPRPREGWAGSILTLVRHYADVVHAGRFWRIIVPTLLLSNLSICMSAWLAAQSIGVGGSLADLAVVVEGGSLAALLPVSIGGWGVREGTVAFLLIAMGQVKAEALAMSALLGIMIAVVGLAGAAIWIFSPYKRAIASAAGQRKQALQKPAGSGTAKKIDG